jgi:hypothetical protein
MRSAFPMRAIRSAPSSKIQISSPAITIFDFRVPRKMRIVDGASRSMWDCQILDLRDIVSSTLRISLTRIIVLSQIHLFR